MKAFQLHGQTGPDSLRLVDLPEPKPGHGQVLVRVRANALNYRDLMISDGRYGKINVRSSAIGRRGRKGSAWPPQLITTRHRIGRRKTSSSAGC